MERQALVAADDQGHPDLTITSTTRGVNVHKQEAVLAEQRKILLIKQLTDEAKAMLQLPRDITTWAIRLTSYHYIHSLRQSPGLIEDARKLLSESEKSVGAFDADLKHQALYGHLVTHDTFDMITRSCYHCAHNRKQTCISRESEEESDWNTGNCDKFEYTDYIFKLFIYRVPINLRIAKKHLDKRKVLDIEKVYVEVSDLHKELKKRWDRTA
jgi:hypothetical protein